MHMRGLSVNIVRIDNTAHAFHMPPTDSQDRYLLSVPKYCVNLLVTVVLVYGSSFLSHVMTGSLKWRRRIANLEIRDEYGGILKEIGRCLIDPKRAGHMAPSLLEAHYRLRESIRSSPLRGAMRAIACRFIVYLYFVRVCR